MTVNKLQLPAKENAVQLKINEIIDNLGGGGANTDLSNLTATGEAHFAKIFVAEYGVTSYADVLAAYNEGKTIVCKYTTNIATDTVNRFLCLEKFQFTPNTTVGSFLFGSLVDGANSGVYYMTLLNNASEWSTLNSYNCEQTSNKVTSISSSSTNTQYPSAKLLYDQLALKQNTSTAVTHAANTQVGSSSTPVYIASNGTATSTGLSIASSRFDGQWVYNFLSGSSATAVGTVTIDLSSYLPSDSYRYEVLINLCLYSNPSSGVTDVFLWSDVFQNTNTGQDERVARCNANSRASENRFTMPVGTGRWIKRQIVDKAATVCCNVSFWGYRRIGTNT